MSAPPPAIITFVAVEPPQNHSDKGGAWLWSSFRVRLDQLESQAALIAERLRAEGREVAQVVVCHADEFGNLPEASREAVERLKPSIVYCCHPYESRRQNPALPIQGWGHKRVLFSGREGSRIVQIVFEG